MRSLWLILFILHPFFSLAQDEVTGVLGKWVLNSVYRNNELFFNRNDSTVLINFCIKNALREKGTISPGDSMKIYKMCAETNKDFKSTFIDFKKDSTYETADETSILPAANGTYKIWTNKQATHIITSPDNVHFTLIENVLTIKDISESVIEMEFIKQ